MGGDGRPVRVQLHRTRGWRKPPGTIVVARPSRWSNPFRMGPTASRAEVVARFRAELEAVLTGSPAPTAPTEPRATTEPHATAALHAIAARLPELRGADLACWCPLDEPCHADVLIDLANR